MENAELTAKLHEYVPDAEILFTVEKNDITTVLDAESIMFGTFKDDMGETIPIIQFILQESDIYDEYSTED